MPPLSRVTALVRPHTALTGAAGLFPHASASRPYATSGGERPPMRDAVHATEDDPAVVLRRVQAENAAKAAALRQTAPPAPPRRPGKPMFFASSPADGSGDAVGAAAGAESPTVPDGAPALDATRAAAASGDLDTPGWRMKPPRSSSAARGPLAGRKTTSTAGQAGGPTTSAFIAKLDKMDAEAKSPTFPTFDAAAEQRRRHIAEKIKEERKRLLVFRDVGMDLDKPILSRDVFLIFKYFRYGMEFAVDNELERQLRYFNEHALNELKIIQDSKVMRGPPTLSRRRAAPKRGVFASPGSAPSSTRPASSSAAGATPITGESAGDGRERSGSSTTAPEPAGATAPFQLTSSFPRVRCANMLQFCPPFDPPLRATARAALHPSASSSFFAQFLLRDGAGERARAGPTDAAPARFDARDPSQAVTLSPAAMQRPAVVIFSQLGQKFGTQCDEAWRRLAYTTIAPAVVPFLPPAAAETASVAAATAATLAAPPPPARTLPIDVVSLRSADLYRYHWVHALYVRRLARLLADRNADEKIRVGNYLTAATTFVGTRLLEPFYSPLGLRNYLLPHAMLVDHEGVVRWLSGGMPDAYEAEHFPALLRQLESEYYAARHPR